MKELLYVFSSKGSFKFSNSLTYSTSICISTRYQALRISLLPSLRVRWVSLLPLVVPSQFPSWAPLPPEALKSGAPCSLLLGLFHTLSLGITRSLIASVETDISIVHESACLNLSLTCAHPDSSLEETPTSHRSYSHTTWFQLPNVFEIGPLYSFLLLLPYCRQASCLTWTTLIAYPHPLWFQMHPLSVLPGMTFSLTEDAPFFALLAPSVSFCYCVNYLSLQLYSKDLESMS